MTNNRVRETNDLSVNLKPITILYKTRVSLISRPFCSRFINYLFNEPPVFNLQSTYLYIKYPEDFYCPKKSFSKKKNKSNKVQHYFKINSDSATHIVSKIRLLCNEL